MPVAGLWFVCRVSNLLHMLVPRGRMTRQKGDLDIAKRVKTQDSYLRVTSNSGSNEEDPANDKAALPFVWQVSD